MRLTVWCPKCNKKYGVKEEFRAKKLKCKVCAHVFRVGEALNPPADLSAPVPIQSTAPVAPAKKRKPVSKPAQPITQLPPEPKPSPVAPQPVQQQMAPQPIPSQPLNPALPVAEVVGAEVVNQPVAGGEDLSQYFHGSSSPVAAPAAPVNQVGYPQVPTEPVASVGVRHVSSPWMIPAILLAVFGSLGLGAICFGGRMLMTVGAVVDKVAEKRDQLETEVSSGHSARSADTDPRLDTSVEETIEPSIQLDEQISTDNSIAGLMAEDTARMKAVEDATREAMANAERKEREERDAARATRDREREAEREKKREKERLASIKRREEYEAKQLAEKENEKRLTELEGAAAADPEAGLISRMQVEGFGAKGMVLTNEGILFVITSKKILAFNSERSKQLDVTNKARKIKRFHSIALSDNGAMMAISGYEGTIELFKLNRLGNMVPAGTLEEHSANLTHLLFNKDGTRLASIDRKNKICFWDTSKNSLMNQVEISKRIVAVHVNSESESIRCADSKGWETYQFESGELADSGEYPFRLSSMSTFLQDGNRIASGGGSEINIYKADQREPIQKLKGHGVQWTVVNISDDKILSGANTNFYQWDLTNSKLERVWSVPDIPYVQKIVLSPDRTKVAVTKGSVRDDIFVFDLNK